MDWEQEWASPWPGMQPRASSSSLISDVCCLTRPCVDGVDPANLIAACEVEIHRDDRYAVFNCQGGELRVGDETAPDI